MGIKEGSLEKAILQYLRAIGVFCWKNDSVGIAVPTKVRTVLDPKTGRYKKKQSFRKKNRYHINGVSDILGVLPNGRFLAIEVKKPDEHKDGKLVRAYASTDQKIFIENVNNLGGLAFIARSIDDVLIELEKYFPSGRKLNDFEETN